MKDARERTGVQLHHYKCLLYFVLPACLSVSVWYMTMGPDNSMNCHPDFTGDERPICKLKCPAKQFALPWMESCRPFLNCQEIESTNFKIIRHIGNGAVKMVYLAEWNGHQVALNTLLNPDYRDDFQHGMQMLLAFQGSLLVTQLVGYCKNSYLTEYHKLGSAENLSSLLRIEPLSKYRDSHHLMQMCQSYAEIVHFMHNSPIGTRVLCDSNDLRKTLQQFLVREDLRLVANDLDALPMVNRTEGILVKCGHQPIYGEFAAPEQLWPHEGKEFDDDIMPPYDEKSDIWKIPKVCEHFLAQTEGSDIILFHLFKIHKQCRNNDPSLRPSASEVLEIYTKVLEDAI